MQKSLADEKKFKGFSGSTLKIVAIITMLIDHIGAVVLQPLVTKGIPLINLVFKPETIYDKLFFISRTIGRIAFPLFCFLLVEGFIHTSNIKKYALRLGIFALISEIPFDLAFSSGILVDYSSQNVFFTLLIGLGALYFIDKYKHNKALSLLSFLAACILAEFLHADYGMNGIIPIVLFYITRNSKKHTMIAGIVSFLFEAPLFLAVYLSLPLIYFYNGKRGLNLKYFFYAFYPCHLLLLYLVKIIVINI